MINVNSTITLNMAVIGRLCGAQIEALEQTAEELLREVRQAQVMPRDSGKLQGEGTSLDNSHSSSGKVSLVSSTPYARRLYFHPEYHFSKEENPNAKGEWYEDYIPGGKYDTFAQEAYRKIYRRIAGL